MNPYMLDAKAKRWNNPVFAGGKVYFAVLSGDGWAKRCRHTFKRASEAEAHAVKIREYLMLRYDRENARMTEPTTE